MATFIFSSGIYCILTLQRCSMERLGQTLSARKVYRNVSNTDRKIILIPGFLKTGLAKISTHSTTWQPSDVQEGGGGDATPS